MGNLTCLASGLSGLDLMLVFASATPAHAACPTCGHQEPQSALLWLMIGFLGQAIFTARFLAQWVASERKRDSVVPVIFWWLSMGGGLTLLCYAIHRQDPVIIAGQSMGVFIYIRNLMLLSKNRRRRAVEGEADTQDIGKSPAGVPAIPRHHLPSERAESATIEPATTRAVE